MNPYTLSTCIYTVCVHIHSNNHCVSDKFKFVLDFKIRELKQQIEPRQKEIADMKNKIKQMDDALENYHLSNSDLDAKIGWGAFLSWPYLSFTYLFLTLEPSGKRSKIFISK